MRKLSIYITLVIAGCQLPAVNLFSQTWDTLNSRLWSPGGGAVITLYATDTLLYIAGGFQRAGGPTGLWIDGFTAWDGAWYQFGSGINGVAEDIQSYKGYIYAGGGFSSAGGAPNTTAIARWNWSDSSWSTLNGDQPNNDIWALSEYQDTLYVCGGNPLIGGVTYNYIAKWDDTAWSDVGGGVSAGGITRVTSSTIYNNELVIGGVFGFAGGVSADYIASWDGSQWKALGGGAGSIVNAFAVDTISNELYVGGGFFTVDDTITANFVAKWDGTNWYPLGNGFNNGVAALEYYHGEIYAALFATNQADTNIFRWNGKEWNILGGQGTNNSTVALEVYNDTLFVGGYFDLAGGDSAYWIAKWYTPPCAYLEAGFSFQADTLFMPDSLGIQFTDTTNQSQTWLWDFGDGEIDTVQNPMHYYDSSGIYIVTLIVNHGNCADTAYETLVVVGAGVKDFQSTSFDLRIYPNPTDGRFTVEINAGLPIKNCQMKIYDLEGRMVKELAINSEPLTIDTDGWAEGIYICKLEAEGTVMASRKIVVTK